MSEIVNHSGKAVLQSGSARDDQRTVALIWHEVKGAVRRKTVFCRLSKDGFLPPPGSTGTPFAEAGDFILLWDTATGSYRPFVLALDPALNGIIETKALLPVGDVSGKLAEILTTSIWHGELLKGLDMKDKLNREHMGQIEAGVGRFHIKLGEVDERLSGKLAATQQRIETIFNRVVAVDSRVVAVDHDGAKLADRVGDLEQDTKAANDAFLRIAQRLDAVERDLAAATATYARLNEAVGVLEYAASQGPVTPEMEAAMEEAWESEKASEHAIGGTDLAGNDLTGKDDDLEDLPPAAKIALGTILGKHLRQRTRWTVGHDRQHTDPEWAALFGIYLGRFALEATNHTGTTPEAREAVAKLGALCLSYLEARR